MSKKQLVRLKHIAKSTDLCDRSIANLMARKLIPYYKIGRAVRFDPDEVMAALERLKVRA